MGSSTADPEIDRDPGASSLLRGVLPEKCVRGWDTQNAEGEEATREEDLGQSPLEGPWLRPDSTGTLGVSYTSECVSTQDQGTGLSHMAVTGKNHLVALAALESAGRAAGRPRAVLCQGCWCSLCQWPAPRLAAPPPAHTASPPQAPPGHARASWCLLSRQLGCFSLMVFNSASSHWYLNSGLQSFKTKW